MQVFQKVMDASTYTVFLGRVLFLYNTFVLSAKIVASCVLRYLQIAILSISIYIIFEVWLCPVLLLLGGKGVTVRVSMPFINAFPWYTIIFMPPKLLL